MIRTDWNALRVGHHVLVHDEGDPAAPLIPGRVTEVEDAAGANQVTVRVKPPGRASMIVQPRRLAVHLDSGEATDRCWRCEIRFGTSPPPAPPKRRSRSTNETA